MNTPPYSPITRAIDPKVNIETTISIKFWVGGSAP